MIDIFVVNHFLGADYTDETDLIFKGTRYELTRDDSLDADCADETDIFQLTS